MVQVCKTVWYESVRVVQQKLTLEVIDLETMTEVEKQREEEIRRRVEFFEKNESSIKSDFNNRDNAAVAVIAIASFIAICVGYFI